MLTEQENDFWDELDCTPKPIHQEHQFGDRRMGTVPDGTATHISTDPEQLDAMFWDKTKPPTEWPWGTYGPPENRHELRWTTLGACDCAHLENILVNCVYIPDEYKRAIIHILVGRAGAG